MVDVDLQSITTAEWDDIRRVTGREPSELLDSLDGQAQTALAWVVMRRDDPSLPYDDVAGVDVEAEQVEASQSPVDVMARVCVALRIGPDEFRRMSPVEVAAVVNVLDEQMEVDDAS